MAIGVAVLGLMAAGGEPPAGSVHALAFVNDPLSHGVLGDGLLSLDEAIRLHNGTLLSAQLSPGELAQLSLIPGTGTTTFVSWIDIDGTNTPLITVEQDLTPIANTTWGLLIKGFGDLPVLDFSGPGLQHGLRAPTNALVLQDLVLSGGVYGVDVVQTDASGQPGVVLSNVRFEDHAQFGLRVTALTAGGAGRVILERCRFENVHSAVEVDESGSNRISIFEAHEVDVAGASFGISATVGAGGSTRYTFDRVTIDAVTAGIRIQRGPTANRPAYVEGSFVRVRALDAVDIDCHSAGTTWLQLHLWNVRSTGGGDAMIVGPGAVFGDLTDFVVEGNFGVSSAGGPAPITIHNLRGRNSYAAVSPFVGQVMAMRESRFDGGGLLVLGSAPLFASDCCFVGATLVASASSPLQLANCFAPVLGPSVTSWSPSPVEHLGSMSITPESVALGASVTFVAELPPGLVGYFALGFTDPTPTELQPGLWAYVDLAQFAFAPGSYQLQQSFTWNTPASIVFLGTDLTVQMVVLPGTVASAPWVQLPPGRRFVLQ
jgi:hypothetical protein